VTELHAPGDSDAVTRCTSPFGCDRVPYDHAGLCICHSEDPNKDVQAFQREIADMLQRRDHRFGGFVFPDEVRSASASFESAASFTGVTFQGAATFSGVRFEGKADFSGAAFRGATVFGGDGDKWIFSRSGGADADFRWGRFHQPEATVFQHVFLGCAPAPWCR
jgi:uncharacterized protein YjbI with pentapeptide repeats